MESSDAAVLALQGAQCIIHVEEKGAGMARATVMVPGATAETTMPRGRRPKRGKAPTKLERLEKLRERILTLGQDLLAEGFGAQLPPPGPIRLTAEAIRDPKTGGWIGHVEEPLGTYIQRVSIVGNFSQRPPFDHIIDPIYRQWTPVGCRCPRALRHAQSSPRF